MKKNLLLSFGIFVFLLTNAQTPELKLPDSKRPSLTKDLNKLRTYNYLKLFNPPDSTASTIQGSFSYLNHIGRVYNMYIDQMPCLVKDPKKIDPMMVVQSKKPLPYMPNAYRFQRIND